MPGCLFHINQCQCGLVQYIGTCSTGCIIIYCRISCISLPATTMENSHCHYAALSSWHETNHPCPLLHPPTILSGSLTSSARSPALHVEPNLTRIKMVQWSWALPTSHLWAMLMWTIQGIPTPDTLALVMSSCRPEDQQLGVYSISRL